MAYGLEFCIKMKGSINIELNLDSKVMQNLLSTDHNIKLKYYNAINACKKKVFQVANTLG